MIRRTCTCAGTEPGYPQHEPFCAINGGPETDDEWERAWARIYRDEERW